jgi:hypothetical protein
MKHFNVIGWFQKVLLVLGVVILAGGGWNVVQVVLASVRSLGSGGSPSPMVAVADRDLNELAKAGTLTPEQQEAIRKSQEAAKGALAGAAAAEADAKKALKNAEAAAQETVEAGKKAEKEAALAAKTAESEAAKAVKKEESAAIPANTAAAATAEKEREPEKPAKNAAAPAARHPGTTREAEEDSGAEKAPVKRVAVGSVGVPPTSTPFTAFLARREAVEKAINDDPALLRKADLRNAYEKYLRKTYEVRQKWAKKKKKDFATDKINDHLKDLDVFESTSKMVDEIHDKIFH